MVLLLLCKLSLCQSTIALQCGIVLLGSNALNAIESNLASGTLMSHGFVH